MADATYIPIKGDWNKTNIHGIVPVTVCRTTELDALRPRRGVYNPKDPDSFKFEPPTYLAPDGQIKAMVWCPTCGDWQRREGFYKNRSRRSGLDWQCRTCSNPARAERLRKQRARKRENYKHVPGKLLDSFPKAA